ncbi:unnamed protein product [Linum tenue]|uniref:Uncharacterized protein n=1 Tax=Linum tenue TaxID=586396 RepID=A0AAV0NW99_9ROSI|nr:unnamed protein product [Linum tenue]
MAQKDKDDKAERWESADFLEKKKTRPVCKAETLKNSTVAPPPNYSLPLIQSNLCLLISAIVVGACICTMELETLKDRFEALKQWLNIPSVVPTSKSILGLVQWRVEPNENRYS